MFLMMKYILGLMDVVDNDNNNSSNNDDNDDVKTKSRIPYKDAIYEYYFQLDSTFKVDTEYMEIIQNNEINSNMRCVLIDWIISVHDMFEPKYVIDTLFLAVNIIDQFLMKYKVSTKDLQLVGMVASWIAAKYEEEAEFIDKYIVQSDYSYTREEMKEMEINILTTLYFKISFPIIPQFLRMFLEAPFFDDQDCIYSKYIAELVLLNLDLFKYSPSKLAAGIIYIVIKNRKENIQWDEEMINLTRHSEADVKKIAIIINKWLGTVIKDDFGKKYSSTKDHFHSVEKYKTLLYDSASLKTFKEIK